MSSKVIKYCILALALTFCGAAVAQSSGSNSQTGGTSDKTPGATENMNPKGTDADSKAMMDKHGTGTAGAGATGAGGTTSGTGGGAGGAAGTGNAGAGGATS